jgi:hypothetical protein
MALCMAMASPASLNLTNPNFLRLRTTSKTCYRMASKRFTVRFSTETQEKETKKSEDEPAEKRSLAVATGEFFLGIAARLLKYRVLRDDERRTFEDDRKDRFSRVFSPKNNKDDEDIASVTKDEIDPSVLWEQRRKDVDAERERRTITSPGFSFSAAGLLFPYHLGVAQCLIEKGYLTENTPLAGSSAGAIVCAVIASGESMKEALRATKVLAEDCRSNGTAFRLGAVLRGVLEKFLPDDVHIKASGRIRVAITQVFRSPIALLIDQFDSKEDLINAVITSSFIPGYLAPTPVTIFRNRICIDGGLTLFMPPTCADNTIRVCAFPLSRLGLQGIGISPDCYPENRASARQLFNWALEPADDDILDELFDLGYRDANIWTKQNPVEDIVKPNMVVEVL